MERVQRRVSQGLRAHGLQGEAVRELWLLSLMERGQRSDPVAACDYCQGPSEHSEPNASIQMAKQSVVNMHNGLGDSAGELEKRFHWESSVRLAQVTR